MVSTELADDPSGIDLKPQKSVQSPKSALKPALRSVKDSAAILGLGYSTTWLMVKTGELPSIKIRGRRLISDAYLERLIATGSAK